MPNSDTSSQRRREVCLPNSLTDRKKIGEPTSRGSFDVGSSELLQETTHQGPNASPQKILQRRGYFFQRIFAIRYNSRQRCDLQVGLVVGIEIGFVIDVAGFARILANPATTAPLRLWLNRASYRCDTHSRTTGHEETLTYSFVEIADATLDPRKPRRKK